jgi:quercetin dioxygenase-like cupin family protein
MLLHSGVPRAPRRWNSSLLALTLSILLALGVTLEPASTQPALATATEATATEATAAEQASSRPTTSFEAWFVVEQPPTVPFDAVQLVVDFPVGAKVARHLHGGPGYITMLDNEMTMWIGADGGRAYQSGESFVEPFKVVAEGANLSAMPSSLLVTYLIPAGSAVTTLESAPAGAPTGQLPPGAISRFESRLRFDSASGHYRVGQMLQTYAPGAWTMSEVAAAPRLLTVVSGEVTVLTGASEKTYKAGQSWTETAGTAWLSGNMGSGPAVVAASTVVPQP